MGTMPVRTVPLSLPKEVNPGFGARKRTGTGGGKTGVKGITFPVDRVLPFILPRPFGRDVQPLPAWELL